LAGAALVATAAMFLAFACSRGADDPIAFNAAPPTLLVLLDGTVIYGRITEVAGGYQIDDSKIQQVLPYEYVRLAAGSLDEAYIKQRDALQKPNAGDHLQLARWCHSNKLYAQATEQLAAALKLEPTRSEARALLQQVAEASPEQLGGVAGGDPAGTAGDTTAVGVAQNTQAEFVRRIQPILVNRCGNASCHGAAARNELKLAYVRSSHRQQRLETENNLQSVLRQIDRRRPDNSPLLSVPLDAGSRKHRNLFSGAAGTKQVELIRAWVRRAARELQQHDPDRSLWAGNEDAGVVPAGFTVESFPFPDREAQAERRGGGPVAGEAAERSAVESPLMIEIPRTPQGVSPPGVSAETGRDAASSPPRPAPRGKRPPQESTKLLREILEQDRPDAFDPDEFNRQTHGLGASPGGQ
jgi:hypothetical protein